MRRGTLQISSPKSLQVVSTCFAISSQCCFNREPAQLSARATGRASTCCCSPASVAIGQRCDKPAVQEKCGAWSSYANRGEPASDPSPKVITAGPGRLCLGSADSHQAEARRHDHHVRDTDCALGHVSCTVVDILGCSVNMTRSSGALMQVPCRAPR